MPEFTPMMRQYNAIKAQHGDCILFFRLGDFYEMFDEDARLASRELDLTLTTRDRGKEKEDQVPMCGVPYHSSEAYIGRLIAKGYKVAICEQMEDPALAKGLVERDVIRIITPGTATDASMLADGASNYIGAICVEDTGAAVCFADISTGEICARSFDDSASARIVNELGRYAPSELVLNTGAAASRDLTAVLGTWFHTLSQTADERFEYAACAALVCRQFAVDSLDELGLGQETQAVRAIGALLGYVTETQKADLSYINKLDFYTDGRYMELDLQTLRNLELLYNMRTREKRGSLLWAMDKTKTPMGSRLIRSWVARPLLSLAPISRRLAAVNELTSDSVARGELAGALRGIGDMERIIGKTVFGTVNCKDLTALSASIARIPEVLAHVEGMTSPLMQEIRAMDDLADIKNSIDETLCDDPPVSVREGGMVRAGFDPEVDRLRSLLRGSKTALSEIEAREKARTGKKLRIGYNKVFGYYIEIPRAQSEDVPEDYIRKQTLVNCERFITEELKNLEEELLTAGDRLNELEFKIFSGLRRSIAGQVLRVQSTAQELASLDVLCSFAQCAADYNWCMPEVTAEGGIDIVDGRHPVVELTQKDTLFVPNDTHLSPLGADTAIITGPNMAGKSTYMRQTALICLMAQIGSFVPARTARVGLLDRVFTRIGASDDLAGGMSTFMVEMSEVASILKAATSRSLILLDEIGRGTSTYDGMAIARAVLEYCADKRRLGARTMFATHYHELTALEGQVEGVKNYNISAKKRGDELIFLRKIVPGGADDSYGVEVAKLAGVPDAVIRRAKAVLADLTAGRASAVPARMALPETGPDQISLGSLVSDQVTEELRNLDINTLTPLECQGILDKLIRKVRS